MPRFCRFPHRNWIGDPPTALSLANCFDRPMCAIFVPIETKGCMDGFGTGGGNGRFPGGRFESNVGSGGGRRMGFFRNAWRKILTEPRQGPKPAAPEFRPTKAHHRFPRSSQNRASISVFTPQIVPRNGPTTFCPDRDKRLRRFCRDFPIIRGFSCPTFLRFPHGNWIGDPPTALRGAGQKK